MREHLPLLIGGDLRTLARHVLGSEVGGSRGSGGRRASGSVRQVALDGVELVEVLNVLAPAGQTQPDGRSRLAPLSRRRALAGSRNTRLLLDGSEEQSSDEDEAVADEKKQEALAQQEAEALADLLQPATPIVSELNSEVENLLKATEDISLRSPPALQRIKDEIASLTLAVGSLQAQETFLQKLSKGTYVWIALSSRAYTQI